MNNAEQYISILKQWNSREHQLSLRIQTTRAIIARGEQLMAENRKLIIESKRIAENISVQTNSILDKIALARLIVKEMINQN